MKKAFFSLLIIFFVSAYLFLFSAFSVSAFTIVSCETADNPNTPCNLCEALQMVSRSMRFALYIIIPGAAAFAFMIGGAFLLFAGGNENNIKTGQGIIRVVIYGILIAFGGFIIVNTIISELANPEAFNWTKSWYQVPNCSEEAAPDMPAIAAPQVNVSVGRDEALEKAAGQIFETLDNKTALKKLNDTGLITINCVNFNMENCKTNFKGIPEKAIDTLIEIAEKTKKSFVVTGGTDTECADCHKEHGQGQPMVDIRWDGGNDLTKPDENSVVGYILKNKSELGIVRIGCPPATYKKRIAGCDFPDKGSGAHLHIQTEKYK